MDKMKDHSKDYSVFSILVRNEDFKDMDREALELVVSKWEEFVEGRYTKIHAVFKAKYKFDEMKLWQFVLVRTVEVLKRFSKTHLQVVPDKEEDKCIN